MKCPDQKTLFEFSHRLMGAWKEDAIRAHLAACQGCRAVVEEYAKLDAMLAEWRASEPSSWFDERVRAAIEDAPTASRRFWVSEHFRALAVASLAMIFVAGGLIIFRGHSLRRTTTPRAGKTEHRPQAEAMTGTVVRARDLSAEEEVRMDKNLPVLEDYDMLADFDVLSEWPSVSTQVRN